MSTVLRHQAILHTFTVRDIACPFEPYCAFAHSSATNRQAKCRWHWQRMWKRTCLANGTVVA